MDASEDPVVHALREQISGNDLVLVEAINERVRLLTRMREHKASRGYDAFDPARETLMLRRLEQASSGPLSPEGLAEIYGTLLSVTQREAGYETAGRHLPGGQAATSR